MFLYTKQVTKHGPKLKVLCIPTTPLFDLLNAFKSVILLTSVQYYV